MKSATPKMKKKYKYEIPCDLCDFVAPRRFHLMRHIKAKHNMNLTVTGTQMKNKKVIHSFPCDLCDYMSPRTADLIRHKQAKHKEKDAVFDPVKNQVWLFLAILRKVF